jgi:hypothetical protein
MNTREVPLGVALSVGTGIALCDDFSAVHELIEWMVGEPTWTHQLPRVGLECKEWMKRCDPRIAALKKDEITPENWREWLAGIEAEWGPTVTLHRMPGDDHTHIDPLTEGVEIFGEPPIVIVADKNP